jgi:hypothetical protein
MPFDLSSGEGKLPMRVWTKSLLTAALVAPMALTVVGSGGTAVAAGGTSCGKSSGTATFKPALPVSGNSTTVKPKVIVKKGKVSACKGGGVTGGTFVSTSKFHTATNCDKLLSGTPSKNPPTGTITTTWNTGKTSTGTVTLNPVSGAPTQTHITGTVTSGLFKGKTLSATLQFAPKKGDCLTTPLSQVTFSLVSGTKLTIK